MTLEPELGDFASSMNNVNGPHTWGVPRHIVEDLHDLAERVGTKRGDWHRGWGSLTSNSGAEEYKDDVFALRSYCWCEGYNEGHEDECPPLFQHFSSGLNIEWYKHAARGAVMNQEILKSQWRAIFDECVASVGVSEEQVMARRKEDSAECKECHRPSEELVQENSDNAITLRSYGLCVECEANRYREFEDMVSTEREE